MPAASDALAMAKEWDAMTTGDDLIFSTDDQCGKLVSFFNPKIKVASNVSNVRRSTWSCKLLRRQNVGPPPFVDIFRAPIVLVSERTSDGRFQDLQLDEFGDTTRNKLLDCDCHPSMQIED